MDLENNIPVPESDVEVKAPENFALGIVGALVGALIGGASIVLLSQLGYIASISGFILAFCTLKGYQLLAKGISTKGVVVCAVFMLLTPFVADWIDWAILLMESWSDYGITFMEAVVVIPELLADGTIVMSEYLKNLGMIYLFVVLGGYYTVKETLKGKK